MSLDNLAHRYGCLPSEALARATTFDLKVLHTANKFREYHAGGTTDSEKRIKYQANNNPLTTEQMLEMSRKAKEQHNANKERLDD